MTAEPLPVVRLSDVPPGWGDGWTRQATIDHGGQLAELGFGIVRVYHPLGATTCSCPKGAACPSAGKHPIGDDWQKRAEHDPERVRTMLGNPGNRSYGIVPPPGVFSWDVDGDAPDRLRELTATLGPLPPTRVHRTGNGRHVFYRWPESIPGGSGNLFGIVTRWAPGGMTVGPGSIHAGTGQPYAVEHDLPIAELPESWARGATGWADTTHRAQDGAEPGDPEWAMQEGARHPFLVRQAARLRATGLRGDALADALLSLNAERCRPPKEEAEVRRLAADYSRKDDDGGGMFLSAEAPVPSGRNLLPYLTARELAALAAEWTPWLGFGVASRCVTELDGKPKTAGKTTWLCHLARAVLDGAPFLGWPTTRTAVVMLSEQGHTSLRATLGRAGLLDRDDLYLVPWHDARELAWPALVAAAVELCGEKDAGLLIVDTLPQFARLAGDAENDAGAALLAMEPLQAAAAAGLAVLVSRHDRKSGGDVGDSGRGSGAFTGAVDIVLALRRGGDGERSTIRHLHGLSRFDEVPQELVIDLSAEGYHVIGTAAGYALLEARETVLDCLPAEGSEGMTMPELVKETEAKRTTVQAAVDALRAEGRVARSGAGKRGDPFRYTVSAEPVPPPAETPAETAKLSVAPIYVERIGGGKESEHAPAETAAGTAQGDEPPLPAWVPEPETVADDDGLSPLMAAARSIFAAELPEAAA